MKWTPSHDLLLCLATCSQTVLQLETHAHSHTIPSNGLKILVFGTNAREIHGLAVSNLSWMIWVPLMKFVDYLIGLRLLGRNEVHFWVWYHYNLGVFLCFCLRTLKQGHTIYCRMVVEVTSGFTFGQSYDRFDVSLFQIAKMIWNNDKLIPWKPC